MFNKLITSSQNPKELSLTVRSILIAIVPVVIAFTGIQTETVNIVVDSIVDIVYFASSIVAALGTLYGLYRKYRNGRWSASE